MYVLCVWVCVAVCGCVPVLASTSGSGGYYTHTENQLDFMGFATWLGAIADKLKPKKKKKKNGTPVGPPAPRLVRLYLAPLASRVGEEIVERNRKQVEEQGNYMGVEGVHEKVRARARDCLCWRVGVSACVCA